ncbi:DUF663-domain-containing protein [Meredithblackwellia eburnea MCA 4105]
MSHSHRPTQKQSNKSFKSKHASKGQLKDIAKGRTHRPASSTSTKSKSNQNKAVAADSKLNRRNHKKQLLLKKKAGLEDAARIFTRKSNDKVARIVAVVPLTDDVEPANLVEQLLASVGVQSAGNQLVRTADIIKFHSQSLHFLLLPPASRPMSLFPIMDACASADFVLFALSSTVEVDEQAETVLRALTGAGLGGSGDVLGVVPTLPPTLSLATSTKQSLHSFLTHFFPTIDKVHCTSHLSEASTVVRALCERIPKSSKWREGRARVLSERLDWVPPSEGDGELGTLLVEGTVRGANLSADRFVHLQGWGDFLVDKITTAPPRVTRAPKSSSSTNMDLTDAPPQDLSLPSVDQDSPASTNVPDDEELLMGEQTWPTEEELASAPAALAGAKRVNGLLPDAKEGTTPKRVRRVPKGTSEYQAAWIVDDEDEDDEEGYEEEEEESEDEGMKEGSEEGSVVADFDDDEEEEEEEDLVSATNGTGAGRAEFEDLSPEAEAAQLQSYLSSRALERTRENRDDLDFPDEVDTPLDVPARERFARYRGLKSFRTSPWDPYEELPVEYSRCFMFEDWKRMGSRMESKARREGVEPGTRVVVHIKNVPRSLWESYNPAHPFVLFGLLKHEHKYSVTHFTIQRNTECHEVVRSKDPLVVQLGPRRFVVNPVFSQHTVRNGGKGSNNVHKFERFLRHGIHPTIATAYLPITFGNTVPAIVFRLPTSPSSPDQHIHLVGSGTLLSSDPTRITAKRLILTGHPFKVHKKTATIRYMFFNQPDVDYFKPVALRTKRGRTGHIRESLGTHGYFKAGFDGPIDQMDTICLVLYKRCFPKWGRVWDGRLVVEERSKGNERGDQGMAERLRELQGGEDVLMD